MDRGNSKLVDLLRQLAQYERVPYRLALFREGDDWKAHTLLVEPGLPDEERDHLVFDYDYGDAHFVGGYISGNTAATWLEQRAGELSPSGVPAPAPVRHFTLTPYSGEQVYWQRYPSHALVDHRTASQPLTLYNVTSSAWTTAPYDVGFLVADGLPFFPSFRAAVYRLIYNGDDEELPTNTTIDPRFLVHLFHNEGWLSSITLSPTAVRATVTGIRIGGSQVTISGAQGVFTQEALVGRTTVTCPLPNGLPSPLYVVLSRGADWLDYYTRDERWPTLRHRQENVTVEFGDKTSEIEALIAQGEGLQVEFKSQVNEAGERFLQTVSAFANGVGGTILVGIENGTGATLGIGSGANVTDEMDTLSRRIRDNLIPAASFHPYSVTLDGKDIIVIHIEPSAGHIYGVKPAKPTYHVRRGATNFPARPEELESIVMARNSVASPWRPS